MLLARASGVNQISCFFVLMFVATKQRMLHWVWNVISLAYEVCGLNSPMSFFFFFFEQWSFIFSVSLF